MAQREVNAAVSDPVTLLPIGPQVDFVKAKWPADLIMGESVRMERLQPAIHASALWEVSGGLQHSALWQYLGEGPFTTRREFEHSLEAAAFQNDPLFYAIVDQQSGQAVGRCSFLNIRPEHGVVEVGHLLFSPVMQKTRAASEALYLMARHAFDDLGFRRYEWKCDALNAKSRRAAERTGFQFEGIFRQHLVVKGRNRDTAWYSILDGEWPRVRQAFQAWLKADNFDQQGIQIKRLDAFMGSDPVQARNLETLIGSAAREHVPARAKMPACLPNRLRRPASR